jgi:hypothetical protein
MIMPAFILRPFPTRKNENSAKSLAAAHDIYSFDVSKSHIWVKTQLPARFGQIGSWTNMKLVDTM